jgi:dienelactone hydrolase
MANMSAPFPMTIAAIVIALSGAPADAQSVARIEVQPISTVTLKTAQILTGDMKGTPATLAGELRIPKLGSDRLPAVILIHGSGGVGSNVDAWAKEINSLGIAAFILDTFTGRGIVNTLSDQSQLDSLAMMIDAYRALALLAQHPRIDPERIAVMGFSKGAVTAVYSSNERFRKLYDPIAVGFAAHIGLYTPCNVQYRDDDKVTGAPIRLFHGIADDYVSIAPCRDYVERLKRAGANVSLTEYPDTYHAYDNALLSPADDLAIIRLILDHQNALAHADSTCRSTITGSVKVNVEPWPDCDSTQIRPPCISMMRLEIASPNPVPPFFLVMALSACWNS